MYNRYGKYEARLNIDSELFVDLKSQFNTYLSHLLQESNVTGKEGELSLKIKITTTTERDYKNGAFVKEWTEPRFSWQLTKKVKENKIDIKSSSGEGYILEFDSEGKPVVKEVPNKQVSLFDQAIDAMENVNKINKQAEALGLIVEDALDTEDNNESEDIEDLVNEAAFQDEMEYLSGEDK